MAILKHIASKNANYAEIQRYLMFEHDEDTNKPILNENGELIPRKGYIMDGINCDSFTFDMECRELNALYRKNESYDEIKSHHYIISFDPKDTDENGLTGERAQKLGMEYARKNFPGHQTLVCTHMDGHNKSGNIHVHIVINSLRKYDVERQGFMDRACDSRAGYKHHLSKDYLIHLKQSLMDLCHREHLHQVDLLAPAEKKITDREYHVGQRGQKKLDERNRQILADGLPIRRTAFQTQKDFLRSAIEASAVSSCSREEFQKLLLEKYNITLKVSRGRFSYLHPERGKYITGRMLGTHYEEDYLLELFGENSKSKEYRKETIASETFNAESEQPADQPSAPLQEAPVSILFIKSDLRLVTNLQDCVKAQQNAAYATNKVKLSNLKEMAKTVAYIQERGYDTRDSLEDSFSEVKNLASSSRKVLKDTEDKLRILNEQIHYTGQYLANKSVYRQFCRAKHKGQFREEHPAEIALYESARKFLQGQSADGRLPSIKLLKAEKEQLLHKKKEAQKTYHYYRDYQKELNTVCSNVDKILGQARTRQPEKQKGADIS
ncbi:relaxase/mobilization nuclease domain-containing protein [Lachnospiraceae bacterium WCA-9-b2]|uniref:Relaxase/mobilization nuclease domain-containing protein n=1 Tax=Sporofaciens musculi TaxID=2681861 RepID=A0A7X3SHL6_9FIRM|nr:relaxase/mobilization nuclease domain-containing protein [Sporofaciens musculi]MXP74487.1 relaxase/mobilization nuclease domain-containing protein [Sporofaciens musculi]